MCDGWLSISSLCVSKGAKQILIYLFLPELTAPHIFFRLESLRIVTDP